ncbi:aromatase/cyclase [Nocardia sp. NPDC055053]
MTTMSSREVEHAIEIAAPAEIVYDLLAEVESWPRIFAPTIYVDHLERSDREERIRIWATANGAVKNWTSHRSLDRPNLTIVFRQEVSVHPVASMSGAWLIEPMSATRTRVRLVHTYRAVDDDPAGLAWIDEAVDRNSQAELAGLRANIESHRAAEDLSFSFEDSIWIAGDQRDVYEFIDNAALWPERLPHVSTVRFDSNADGLQTLEMDTRAKDGSVHTTKSYRIALPDEKIAYKQVTLPALLALHTGRWTFCVEGDGVRATSQHTVALRPENIEPILGTGATAADARDYVRSALSTNSLATLEHARAYAESRR